MTIKNTLRRFSVERRGNIALVAALSFPVFAGGIAMGIDINSWYGEKTRLSFSTDAGAISAANLMFTGRDETTVAALLKPVFAEQDFDDPAIGVAVTYPADAEGELRLLVTHPAEQYFASLVWEGAATASAETIVKFRQQDACVLALNPTAPRALDIGGNASVSLDKCVIAANSNASDAISISGSADLAAQCMVSHGGISGENLAQTECARNRRNAPPSRDPFADRTIPATPASCKNAPNTKPKGNTVIQPGCYKGGMALKGKVTFKPGIYVIDGTDFSINSQADVSGDGVTFVLKNGASVSFDGGANINLNAPVAGTGTGVDGILFWSDPANGGSHKFNGNSSSGFGGYLYFPGDHLQFNGTSGIDTACTRIVADTIDFKGNAGFNSSCADETGNISTFAAGAAYIAG